ncbi:unnamed protein product [Brassica rapa]|uniref:Uncharacterized protein n=2 Tax=Brassica TaxID=3705 RepID=A0A8D9CN87_BRACM|nr:unnamed protein product [Brassica napus]CAG7861730.1 unnamed protein product [Brassica rapa]
MLTTILKVPSESMAHTREISSIHVLVKSHGRLDRAYNQERVGSSVIVDDDLNFPFQLQVL